MNSYKEITIRIIVKIWFIAPIRSLNMFYQWFSVTLCYYGLSFASTSLSGDAYSNFMLSVFIEIPGYIFCLMVMDCWGRRPILSFCQGREKLQCLYGSRNTPFHLTILFFLVCKLAKIGEVSGPYDFHLQIHTLSILSIYHFFVYLP
jgi:hypothetical protein